MGWFFVFDNVLMLFLGDDDDDDDDDMYWTDGFSAVSVVTDQIWMDDRYVYRAFTDRPFRK